MNKQNIWKLVAIIASVVAAIFIALTIFTMVQMNQNQQAHDKQVVQLESNIDTLTEERDEIQKKYDELKVEYDLVLESQVFLDNSSSVLDSANDLLEQLSTQELVAP